MAYRTSSQFLIRVGSETKVNTYTDFHQTGSSTTALDDGGFVVTWSSRGQDSDDWGIFGQMYNADGTPEGLEFLINTYTVAHQTNSCVMGLSDGGFVVAWSSHEQDGDSSGVFAQIYNADGTLEGSEFQVNTHTVLDQKYPSVTSLSDGGFVVSWASNDQDGAGWGIFGQMYKVDGTPEGSEFQVNTYTTGSQEHSSITALSDGGFVVTWHSDGQDGDLTGVFGQMYNADGTTEGSEFQVNTYTTSSQQGPSTTALSDGGFVVTWTSDQQDGSESGIFAQMFNADGTNEGAEFQVNTYWPQNQSQSVVTGLDDGGFVVIWKRDQDLSGGGISGQIYNADGTANGSAFLVNTRNSDIKRDPSVTALSDGSFVVTWSNHHNDWDIFSQTFVANHASTGDIILAGVEAEASTLTADVSAIADAEGIEAATIENQWLRDGVAISGATALDYELMQADVGAEISVRYSYTDSFGTVETILSDPTAAIANTNDAPTGSLVISGALSIKETLSVDTSTIADEDGLGAFSYQWFRDGVAISGATDETYKVTRLDILQPLTVQVTFTDGYGAEESLTSAVATPAALAPGVTVDVIDDTTGEDGSAGSFAISLNSDITSDVAITFTVSDATEASLATAVFTFTPTNWDEVQIVSLLGVDDFDDDGDTPFTVTGVIGTDDILYQALSITPLAFTNLEDSEDAPIEVVGTSEADTMLGMNGDDRLYGRGGRDEIHGGRGDDRLYGQSNDDTIYGGEGNDLLAGGYDDDVLFGGAGNDELYGEIGADRLEGGSGDDLLYGGAGKDTMIGGEGEDKLFGGLGADILRGGGSGDHLGGGKGRDAMFGDLGADYLAGNIGRDVLRGGRGNDRLEGGKGYDELFGGLGNDILSGSLGNDTLHGGGGRDVFVFKAGADYGTDRVLDFKDGIDEIKIVGASFADLVIRSTSAGNIRITIADGNTVVLENIDSSLISAADFDFG